MAFTSGRPRASMVCHVPVDFLAETDGEVADEHHLGERAGVIDEVGDRLRPLAADGAAEFLGRAADDARHRLSRPCRASARTPSAEKHGGGAAVGVVDENAPSVVPTKTWPNPSLSWRSAGNARRTDEFLVGVRIVHAILPDDLDRGAFALGGKLIDDGRALGSGGFIELGNLAGLRPRSRP